MSGVSSGLYNLFFRKNTAMLATVFVSAFAIQMGFDTASDKIWDGINKGRQWKDIKHRYVGQPEEEEE